MVLPGVLSVASCVSLYPMDAAHQGSLGPRNFPGKNIEGWGHFLLQGSKIKPGLLLGKQILYHRATWGALVFDLPKDVMSLPYLICHVYGQ